MIERRHFLQSLAAITASLMASSQKSPAATESDRLGTLLPKRRLGRTGEDVTMLGLGGAHVSNFSQHAEAFIETALEGGIRFFDTAASYNSGASERLYGRYLVPKYRDTVFLMSKAHLHSYSDVKKQLDNTLSNLHTDYLDLWQMHQVMDISDAERRIDGRVIDAFIEAKESGKVRHIGFTGHKDPAAHLRVLSHTDIFETCQMPVNSADPSYGSFIRQVMPQLVDRNLGIIAMKTLACGGFFGGTTWFQGGNKPKICPDLMTVEDAIHFAWSLPISVLVTGPNNPDQLKEKIELAKSFTGMTEEKREELIERVAHLTSKAGVEFYKYDLLCAEQWRQL